MSTVTRSATLPYATAEAATLSAMAHRLLLDPREIGPIRLVGVGYSGLSAVLQESLFPELDQQESEAAESTPAEAVPGPTEHTGWRIGDDVSHPQYGHGWVQGAGHGVVSVRFETRSSGPGLMRTFALASAELVAADPLDSLDWPQVIEQSAPAGDDVGDG